MKIMDSADEHAAFLFERFWEWRLVMHPEYATSVGIHKHDNRLDEYSMNTFLRNESEGRSLLHEAERLQKNSQILSDYHKLNLDLLVQDLTQLLNGMKFKPYFYPVNYASGPHVQFPKLLSLMKKENINDVNLILGRMRLLSQQVDEIISLLKEGIRVGLVMHKVSVSGLPDVLISMSETPVRESPIYKPFLERLKDIDQDTWNRITCEAEGIITDAIYPSLIKLANFVRNQYIPNTRSPIAISSLPNGREYYAACLKFHTTTNLSATEIHNIGLEEVKRITQRMIEVKERVEFEGTIQDFKTHLVTSEKFTFSSAEEILTRYRDSCKKIETKLLDYVQRLPKYDFEVIPIAPELAPTFTFANYTAPPEDGSGLGKFNINTYKPETRKKYEVLATSLHEAMPGHHLQICLTMECGTCPDFRRYTGIKKYYMVPAYFAMNTAYLEGWGLYAEYLGEEMGVYDDDPYDMFGRLSSEMLRACRLVVDTGIHAFEWSRDRAIQYMSDNTAFDMRSISSEIDRYITAPGQACGYKIGEIKIKELRKKAEVKLGDEFDLKAFHHNVACLGAVPLNILEEQIDLYIKKKLMK